MTNRKNFNMSNKHYANYYIDKKNN